MRVNVKGHTRKGKKVKPYSREICKKIHAKVISGVPYKEAIPKEYLKEHLKIIRENTKQARSMTKSKFVEKYMNTPYKDFAGRTQYSKDSVGKHAGEALYKSRLKIAKLYGLK